MISRRSFIQSASIISTASLLDRSYLFSRPELIGLQLYTVRDAMQKDPAATLARVAQIGYNIVEGSGSGNDGKFYGLDPASFANLLKQNGLFMMSAHYHLGIERSNGEIMNRTLLHNWQMAIDDAAIVGLKYMVCGSLSSSERGGADRYHYIADELNVAGEKCKKSGIQLCYHNHDFEFEKLGDKTPYEILLETDANLVKMEMDIYWVSKANIDPLLLIEEHPGRFPLWHVKDMDNSSGHKFTEVGSGIINFKKIFRHAKRAGLQYFFVEQDQTNGSPFDSIAKSISYIKKNIE
ncbi:MAG: sugar phosphate isomerase/epimerase [Ginsengibacter sp.]